MEHEPGARAAPSPAADGPAFDETMGERASAAEEVLPQHRLSIADLDRVKERVHRRFGAFGERAPGQEADERRSAPGADWRPAAKLMAGVALASAFLSFVSHPAFDHPGAWATSFRLDVVFVVVWGPLLFTALAKRKLAESLGVYLVLALFIEAFSEVMFRQMGEGGYWDSILWPASVAFYGTVKELTGLPGASLSVFSFATGGLLYRAVKAERAGGRAPPPRFARDALLVFGATLLALAAVGIATGGPIDWTFRQTIHLVQIPVVGLLFLYALRIPEDLEAVGVTIVTVAVARSLLVFWVYFGVCVPQGITDLPGKPEWCTTHSDSVLFVAALVVLVAHALESKGARARKATLLRAAALGGVIVLAIVLNNRRLAFVSFALALLVVYLTLEPSRRKRRVTAALALAVPLALGYLLVGSEIASDAALWKPAKGIAAILDETDTSALSRDIENENLIYTLEQGGVFPRGFGHEYDHSPNNPPIDLSFVFENYRLIAHNGVLWLWSLAGVVGFPLLWFVYPLAGTLAVRGYRVARSSVERAAALSAVGGTAVCVVQIWGDQGFSSYMTLVMFSLCFAVASRLATAGRGDGARAGLGGDG